MLDTLSLLPPDPILGLMKQFREDPSPHKVDLGVGIYKDDDGNTPIMRAVKLAEQALIEKQISKAYVAPEGNRDFIESILELALGSLLAPLRSRVAAVQTPGGCGALRVAAELVKAASPESTIWVSNPTWGNHIPLLGGAGLKVAEYAYLNTDKSALDWPAMQEAIASQVQKDDVVLLHGCCHNPTGVDLTLDQWHWLADAANRQGFIPFVDMAYQGFGDGLDADAEGLKILARKVPELLLAVSCSKNFGLYRERVGLIASLCYGESNAKATQSHLLSIVRGIYSMPPDHGAAIVAGILTNTIWRDTWLVELNSMRSRIAQLRSCFLDAMAELGHEQFGFVVQQKGMFSYLGIPSDAVEWLAAHRSIYLLKSSRTSIAGLNDQNMSYVAESLNEALSLGF